MSDQKNDRVVRTSPSLLAASEAQATQRLAVGESVRGRVIALGGGSAFVEIGGKGEAVIDLGEFIDPETGDAVAGGRRPDRGDGGGRRPHLGHGAC